MNKNIKIILVIVLVLAVGIFAITIKNKEHENIGEENELENTEVVEDTDATEGVVEDSLKLPSFELMDMDGNVITDDIFKDYDITIISIWQSTWGPCYGELEALNEIYKEYSDKDVNVIGIAIDGEFNSSGVKKAIDSLKLEFANLVPDEEFIVELIKIANSTPTALIVDENGTLLMEPRVGSYGKDKDIEVFKEIIEKLTSSED